MDVDGILLEAVKILIDQADEEKVVGITIYDEPLELLVVEVKEFTLVFGMNALRIAIEETKRFTPAMTSKELVEELVNQIQYEVETEALGIRPNTISLRVD